MLVIRGSELYSHGYRPNGDPWHFLPGRPGDDEDRAFVAEPAAFIIDAASREIELFGALGDPARGGDASAAGSASASTAVPPPPRERLPPPLNEGETGGSRGWSSRIFNENLVPLPLDAPPVHFIGPP